MWTGQAVNKLTRVENINLSLGAILKGERGGRGCGKADKVREVAWIDIRNNLLNVDKGGRGSGIAP